MLFNLLFDNSCDRCCRTNTAVYPCKISMPCTAIRCILLPLINLIPKPIHESENELLFANLIVHSLNRHLTKHIQYSVFGDQLTQHFLSPNYSDYDETCSYTAKVATIAITNNDGSGRAPVYCFHASCMQQH